MQEQELLSTVKTFIGLGENHSHDDTIKCYIAEVKNFLRAGGCSQQTLESAACAGLIARGVLDLWAAEGPAQLSPYFRARAIQMALGEQHV